MGVVFIGGKAFAINGIGPHFLDDSPCRDA
jgi:hypothetical protein